MQRILNSDTQITKSISRFIVAISELEIVMDLIRGDFRFIEKYLLKGEKNSRTILAVKAVLQVLYSGSR